MSSEPAVSIQGLSKSYPLRHDEHDHDHLALAVLEKLKHPLKRRPVDWLWALRDVSFDVGDGEVVGLIGHNGAGKSTLLKVLTRITTPTAGEISIRGRLGSLLEVGTGFHPELTGRENIFLNGSILGMNHREVAHVFDSIVEFAEVERFLDTPVKRFSSGMFVRLAFSVAAHLDRDVLLLDEVLAVGDRNFRAKCFERIAALRDDGRTVILVSHQLDSILENCSRTVVMSQGEVAFDGPTPEAVDTYLATGFVHGAAQLPPPEHRTGSGEARVVEVKAGEGPFEPDEAKVIEFAVEPFQPGAPEFHVALDVCDEDGTVVAHADSRVWGVTYRADESHRLRISIDRPWLREGRYHANLYLRHPRRGSLDECERVWAFDVLPGAPYPYWPGRMATGGARTITEFVVDDVADAADPPGPSGGGDGPFPGR